MQRTDLWCFMFYSTGLVNNVSVTNRATLGLGTLCAGMYVCNNGGMQNVLKASLFICFPFSITSFWQY